MDYSALALIVGIGVYTAFEYRRRERLHREAMSNVRRGQEPPNSGRKPGIPELTMTERSAVVQESPGAGRPPELWRLVTTGGMAVILLVLTILIFVFGLSRGKYFFIPSLVGGAIFGLITVMVVLMLVRDWRSYKKPGSGPGEKSS